MVTGGYSGVGAQLSSILFSKAHKTIRSIKAGHPDSKGSLSFLKVDLSDLTTIKPAVEEFLRKETKLHWMNQNAGVMVPPKVSKGAQGIDLQYQTSLLGPFLLIKLLSSSFDHTAPRRTSPAQPEYWGFASHSHLSRALLPLALLPLALLPLAFSLSASLPPCPVVFSAAVLYLALRTSRVLSGHWSEVLKVGPALTLAVSAHQTFHALKFHGLAYCRVCGAALRVFCSACTGSTSKSCPSV
jgi:hypothetical protein